MGELGHYDLDADSEELAVSDLPHAAVVCLLAHGRAGREEGGQEEGGWKVRRQGGRVVRRAGGMRGVTEEERARGEFDTGMPYSVPHTAAGQHEK